MRAILILLFCFIPLLGFGQVCEKPVELILPNDAKLVEEFSQFLNLSGYEWKSGEQGEEGVSVKLSVCLGQAQDLQELVRQMKSAFPELVHRALSQEVVECGGYVIGSNEDCDQPEDHLEDKPEQVEQVESEYPEDKPEQVEQVEDNREEKPEDVEQVEGGFVIGSN